MIRLMIPCSAVVLTLLLGAGVARAAEPVTLDTYTRAESDEQMRGYVDSLGAFGKLVHFRELYDVDNQITVRGNRDTLYSVGVFDLTTPVTIEMPAADGRFQSLMVVNQDHSVFPAMHEPGAYTFTEEEHKTRYLFVIVRTFANPDDEADMAAAHAAQDAIVVSQEDPGALELPEWDVEQMKMFRDALNVLAATVSDTSSFFGRKSEVDRLDHLMGVACCWGGNPKEAAVYLSFAPEQNDGTTPHSLTVVDVPVDGFWSITVYDADGFMVKNDLDAYSYNDVTAEKNQDGSITINFGACADGRINCLPITQGWNYLVRLYQPQESVLDGSYTFPAAQPVD